MTLIVSVIAADGIVIAGDSLSTLNRQINMNQSGNVACPHCGKVHQVNANFQGNMPQATFFHTEKVLPFLNKFGIGVFGPGLTGAKSVNFLIRSLEYSIEQSKNIFNNVTEIAEKMKGDLPNLLAQELEQEKKSLSDFPENHIFLAFQIVGYDNFQPKSIEVVLGKEVTLNTFDKLGCYASGSREVVDAIWELQKAKPENQPFYQVFSLQEAIDYADFLIRTTINFQRFIPTIPQVGGNIDIALVSPFDEFKWIRQKPLGELLERK